jgi:hypothetical protein
MGLAQHLMTRKPCTDRVLLFILRRDMMLSKRIIFGLDRLPRTLPLDDPRLPGAFVGAEPLRLNSEALPADAMAAAPNHAAQVAAMRAYLRGLCGDYASHRVRFVELYLDSMAAHLDAYRDEVERELARFATLYAPEDWLWSSLRPLPRAWLTTEKAMAPVDVAFWDGTQVIAIDLGGTPRLPGATVCRVDTSALTGDPLALLDLLPHSFRYFWRHEILPRSPFRRPIPLGVLVATS